jgi:hypothetical protein
MKTVFALTYCFEGVDDSLPYASTIAVSEDRTLIEREMKQCVEEDCTEKADDKWDMSCNYHVALQVTNEVQLQHNFYNNLYATYKIHEVTVL